MLVRSRARRFIDTREDPAHTMATEAKISTMHTWTRARQKGRANAIGQYGARRRVPRTVPMRPIFISFLAAHSALNSEPSVPLQQRAVAVSFHAARRAG